MTAIRDFGADTTTDEVLAGVDLTGLTAVVTGASTGIGLETARALASVGATVVLAVRTSEKAAASVELIRATVPDARLDSVSLDLSSLASVRQAAAEVAARHPAISLLINNAGVMYTPFEHTIEGFELQFGTNHIGHFVFTFGLIPALLAGAPARIVNLSSGGHVGSDIVWDDPNFEHRPYDKFAAYGQSKTANILFTVELDRRLAARGVRSYAVHPGMIKTDLGRYMTRADFADLTERAKKAPSGGLPAYKTIPAGAATTVTAATAAGLADTGGVYLADCQVSDQHAPWARDPAAATRLWALTESLVGEAFDV
jgi:NAD(P)-dependent dehydrogenase (short-subunit alcohol dehydrogenase family)